MFSTIAKPGMFGLGMVPKEVFLTYSTQFTLLRRFLPGKVVMVAFAMCGKSPITGEWIYGITRKHVLPFMFFVYYLFVCLTIFSHFYVCNFLFILTNERVIFIFKFII